MKPAEQDAKSFDLSRSRAHDLTASGESAPPNTSSVLQQQKESTARTIGLLITWTFVGTTFLVIAGAFTVLLVRPTDAKPLLLEVATPFLEKVGAFLSATFSPLLAFVLGYYFGKSKDGSGTE